MKLTLKDFGPIDEFTLDLTKDIQFIYGENSVGKSYAVFVLYALVKASEDTDSYGFMMGMVDRKIIEKVKENNGKRLSIDEELMTSIVADLNGQFNKRFKEILHTKFEDLSLAQNTKKGQAFKIIINSDFFNIYLKSLSDDIHIEKITLERKVEIEKKENSVSDYNVYYDGEYSHMVSQRISNGVPIFSSGMSISESFPKLEFLDFQQIYSIPANRVGIYLGMSSFGSVMAELSKRRSHLKNNKSIELPTFSSDIADYFIEIASISSDNSSKPFTSFVNDLERKILKGKIGFDDHRKRIVYYPDDSDIALDLSQTSSMIAEIAIITTFFKYIIDTSKFERSNKQCLLIIEEPESRLHPKTQVALMEIFAELPKYGIKLIVTSHSDFMFTKLGNMIIDAKIDPNTVGTYHMVMGEKGSYDAGDMKPTKDGVEDHNFVEISEKLYEERVDIYDRLNEEHVAAEYHKK